MTRFSSRLPESLRPNALSLALGRLRSAGESWLDLTESNPTAVGLAYPAQLLEPLGDPAGRLYQPDPMGMRAARDSVAADFSRRGTPVPSDRIVLTASTSEAYSLLFKLLCDPGDAVLVPRPSYPLFDLLTRLDGVEAQAYRLEYHGAWAIDRTSLIDAITPQTRAVLVVSPNNPTGSCLRSHDRDWLTDLCVRRGLVLVGDEVFADYPLRPRADACSVLDRPRVLTFALGGLSKSAGLPQVKLGWMAAAGPDAAVRLALQRLEVIADSYLSVSTPAQVAAARLIEAGRAIREAIAGRLDRNLHRLRECVARWPAVSLLEPEGGWSAVLRVPALDPEERLVLRLLEEARVLVYPGYFFDFPREAFLVVSLLPEPEVFATALDRLLPIIHGGDAIRPEA